MSYLDKIPKKNPMGSLAVELMDAAKKFHILHLTVTGPGSYAAHKALNRGMQMILLKVIKEQQENF